MRRVWNGVVVSIVLAAALLITMTVGTASAAAPPNDLFANATVIQSLPFSQTVDTTQATADSTDAQVATACGDAGFQLDASVWYAFTPTSDQTVTVDFSGSSYSPVLGVVTGAPSSFRPVVCSLGPQTFVALDSQTYYMDVAGSALTGGSSGGTVHLSVTGQPTSPLLDQSFTSPSTSTTTIGECCAYVGQTFTAGQTGVLTGINIDVSAGLGTNEPLHVAIRAVDSSGLPSSTVLGETTLGSGSSPPTQLITFPQPILVRAGTQYAIVVNYVPLPEGRGGGTWTGGIDDPYARGSAVLSADGGITWTFDTLSFTPFPGTDNHFQTYVLSKDQCKTGGWKNVPQFKNQGDCVSFIETGK